MSDETCTDFTLKFLSAGYFISIPEIIYIQFYIWKQQFSIQRRVQRTETLMQIHSATQTLTDLTHRLLTHFH